ncbi:uncharacterized protein LOC143283046 isoform X3 [Babylonia areolata]|uniref:uncharacterized protein LOC143283046 isoform X3 n=1 Tax=Babylonia areolata TaxID=304850 RepID=UPI003FD54427
MGLSGQERSLRAGGAVCIVTALSAVILLVCVCPSHGVSVEHLHSEACYGTGDCSLHTLTCGAQSRMAILEASYGFKPQEKFQYCQTVVGDTCPEDCCTYNESADCRQQFTAGSLQPVQVECSHNSSCHIRAQWGDNVWCNTQQRGATSTLSILRAVCVPDAVTLHPCTNSTVSGTTVSLLLSPPYLSSPCQCTLHNTNTSTTTNGNDTSVNFYVYEVETSVAELSVTLEDGNQQKILEFKGIRRTFPATSAPATLPLTATFTFDDDMPDSTSPPQRVWLGFGDQTSLTLRCGQDAVDYAMSLTTTTTAATTTTIPTTTTTPEPNTTSPEPTTTTTAATTTPEATTSPGLTTTDREQTTPTSASSSRDPSTTPLTSAEPQQSTDTLTGDHDTEGPAPEQIIVYAVVGVAALILCAFLYVCVRRLRTKGQSPTCYHFTPPHSSSSSPSPSTTEAVLPTGLAGTWTAANGTPKTTTTNTDTDTTITTPAPTEKEKALEGYQAAKESPAQEENHEYDTIPAAPAGESSTPITSPATEEQESASAAPPSSASKEEEEEGVIKEKEEEEGVALEMVTCSS